jgi:hypothetical protein
MLLVKYLAVVLHVLTAAAFFGLGLPLARQARAFATSGMAVLGEQGARTVRLMTMFAILTLVFSVIAFVLGGITAGTNPFAFYGPQYHTSLLLILVLVGVQVGLVQAGWSSLRERVASGGDASSATKRVAMGVGIAHLVWVVILVLMFWTELTGAVATV